MLTISTDQEINILTASELSTYYAKAYKQGQIDMKEIMDNEI